MRIHATDGVPAQFAGDIIGGYTNECYKCGAFDDVPVPKHGFNGDPYHCKGCGSEIVYRPWYEW